MDIQKIIKAGKDPVIEMEGVEYLLNEQAISAIEQGNKQITLIQLFDGQPHAFDIEVVSEAIDQGILDYLDKKN